MRTGVLSLAVVAVMSTVLAGTVIDPASLRELTAEAALIVRGRVTDVRAVALGGEGIESVATVAVERVLKGDAPPFVSVHVPGGVIGRYRRVMVGAPTLRPEQSAVFFLVRGHDNGWRPVGLSAGVVRVRREPLTGRLLVHPARLLTDPAAAGPVVRGDAARRSVAVDEFEAMVALVLAGARGGAE